LPITGWLILANQQPPAGNQNQKYLLIHLIHLNQVDPDNVSISIEESGVTSADTIFL